MSAALSPDRQTFRETVALVATAAKAKLPLEVNGRVESAARLVLWQDVEPQDDGSILVGSASDPGKTYRLTGQACECQDFTRGQAPSGWCQHRIAAGIAKRVTQLLAQPAAPVVPDVVEPWADNDPETVPPCPTAPALALPEAPASVNVRLTISGRDCQLTLRDSDEARLLTRLQTVLEQYPLPERSAVQPASHGKDQGQETGICPLHGVVMKLNNKNGKTWFSHKTPDGWCKGK